MIHFKINDEPPSISVVMPVWNGEAYLSEAIESILNQSFHDFEFLILDDGSTDSTPQILAEYAQKDARVRIISLNHQGIVVALNRGVTEARADWIVRMDCDDIAHPERLECQWKAVQKNHKAVLCHTQVRIIGEARYITKAGRFIRSEALILLRLCYQCPIVHSTVMFRKEAFHACGGYQQAERHAEDFGLWGRLVLQGTVVGCAMPLLDFRVHQASISKQKLEVQGELSQLIALRHCQQFMRLNENEAKRALNALRFNLKSYAQNDWLWFITHCLPRLNWQSIELWIWALKRTITNTVHTIRMKTTS